MTQELYGIDKWITDAAPENEQLTRRGHAAQASDA